MVGDLRRTVLEVPQRQHCAPAVHQHVGIGSASKGWHKHEIGTVTGTRACRRPVFVLAVLGNTTHTAVLGMYSYWGPRAITYMFGLHGSEADLMFGGLTVGTGILGTLAGLPPATLMCLSHTSLVR